MQLEKGEESPRFIPRQDKIRQGKIKKSQWQTGAPHIKKAMEKDMKQDRDNHSADDQAADDRFSTRLVIRCTAADKTLAKTNALAGGYSDLSAFGRHMLCDQKPKRRSRARTMPLPSVQALAALTRELQSQGNNLNQLAKHLNAGRTPSDTRIDEALHLHEHVLMAILEAFGNT